MTQPDSAAPRSPRRNAGPLLGRLAMAATAASLGLVALTGLLGPSAAVVPLPGGRFPVGASMQPSAWLVTLVLAAAVLLSVGATAGAWAALRNGWSPSPARLLVAGVLAAGLLALVPPVGGADVLSYAAYGHIAAHDGDPYRIRPSSLSDPFARAVEDPWRSTPSVYGPLATAEQEVVVRASGGNLRVAVGLLDAVNAAAFALAAWLLFLLAGADDGRRRRAVLAFGLNPVLLFAVVAGGHVDALVVLAVVGALALLRRSPLGAGVVAGAGVLVKLTAGLPALGWAWHLGRTGGPASEVRAPARAGARFSTNLALAAGILAASGAGYLITGLQALDQARKASSFVSVGTPWRPIRSALQAIVGHAPGQTLAGHLVAAGSLAVTIALVVRLQRDLPDAGPAGTVAAAARAGLVVALAWTLAAPYVLAWYDAVPWALAAMLPVTRHHRILLAHTGMLALAYLPGRVVALPPILAGTITVLRGAASPLVLGLLLIAAITGTPQRSVRDWDH